MLRKEKGLRLRLRQVQAGGNKDRASEPTQLKQEVNNKMVITLTTGTENATSRDRPKNTAITVRDTNQYTWSTT